MSVGAPIDNKNAEEWTLERAEALFHSCLETSSDRHSESNDFIGEVAQENDTYLTQLDYLKKKFPSLQEVYNRIKANCEANCFRSGKTSKIVPSLAIMNLKSNHGWTDRVDTTTQGDPINIPVIKWGQSQ